MDNLTTSQRLDNLESGIVTITNELFEVITDPEVDTVTEEIRLRLNEIHKRLKTLIETAETAYNIIAISEEENV